MTSGDQVLLDELSEMLAVERDRERLYQESLADAPADIAAKVVEYAEQSRRSVLVIEEAIRRLGGDPGEVSPGAEVVHRMTDAMIAATESAQAGRWMYRALHLLSFETRDRMVWRALDALADDRGGETGEVLKTAATAVLSEEALGAHGVDRTEERIGLILEAMEAELAGRLGVSADKGGRRRGIRRLR